MPETTVQEIQTMFKSAAEEMQSRVKEMRQLQSEIAVDKKLYGDATAENKTKMEGIEKRIGELQAEQTKLNRDFNAPPLPTKEVEEIAQKAETKAFLKHLRSWTGGAKLTAEERAILYPEGRTYGFPGARNESWLMRTPEEARALVEDATGQILVTEGLQTGLIRSVAEASIIRPRASVRTTQSNRDKFRTITEFTCYYGQPRETGGALTSSDVTPAADYLYIEDGHGLTWLGVNELEDSDEDLVAFINDSFAKGRATVEDTKFILGAGHASFEPVGLFNGAVITRIVAANAASIIFEDLVDLMYGYDSGASIPIKSVYQNAGVFIMHPFTELACMKIRSDGGGGAGTGPFVWQPSVVAGKPNTIWGHEVLTSTNIAQIAHSADTVFFGDLRSCYQVLDRRGLVLQKLVELKATSGQIGFLYTWRGTGGIIRAEAARILQQA